MSTQETPVRVPGLETSPGVGKGTGLQYSCVKNLHSEAWWATTNKSDNWAIEHNNTQLPMYINFPCLKEYCPLKWIIPFPCPLPQYGSHHPPEATKAWNLDFIYLHFLSSSFCSYHQPSTSHGIRNCIFFSVVFFEILHLESLIFHQKLSHLNVSLPSIYKCLHMLHTDITVVFSKIVLILSLFI